MSNIERPFRTPFQGLKVTARFLPDSRLFSLVVKGRFETGATILTTQDNRGRAGGERTPKI